MATSQDAVTFGRNLIAKVEFTLDSGSPTNYAKLYEIL